MKFRFTVKLAITMIVFAVVISFTIAITDHIRLRHQAIEGQASQIEQNEQMVIYALESVEKAYALFGENIRSRMEDSMHTLLQKYESGSSIHEWNLKELSDRLSFDIYIINRNNEIIDSNIEDDIGLNFSACCGKLARELEERRKEGGFYYDSIDIEQSTGQIKTYGYMATPDKEYMIQLGFSLEEDEIFNQFNFFHTIAELKQKNRSINEINVLHVGGLALGEPAAEGKLTDQRRQAFDETLTTKSLTEFKGIWKEEPATYRYIPYHSKYDNTLTQDKVIEIIYNENDLQEILNRNMKTFIIQLVIVVIITIILSLLISRWVARPMHLAFHDSLTGLKNRAALDELLDAALAAKTDTIALLMIDLDNFKQVNDDLGHDKGDKLLKDVAQVIRTTARKEDVPIRLGGDEFMLIMPSAGQEEAEHTAQRLIEEINRLIAQDAELLDKKISISIGISLAPDQGTDSELLRKKADIALYVSKEKGKNQYQFY